VAGSERRRGTRVFGHEIRYQTTDDEWMKNKSYGWAPKGQLPPEWDQTKADPAVEKAVIFRNHQRHVRADKRHLEDTYFKGTEETEDE
jgi:hypothetical protein